MFFDQFFDRQCFLWRATWNEGLDGFQPRCPGNTPVTPQGVERPALGYLA